MKERLPTAVALAVLATCCAREPAAEGSSVNPFAEGLRGAALDTVTSFNASGTRSGTPLAEIPERFWAPEIAELDPVKVLWRSNNLAMVLRDPGNDADGFYVCVPFSSYYVADGDVIQLTFQGETYRLEPQGCP
jgi:hypothetical protein